MIERDTRRKGGRARLASWALKSYADLFAGFLRRRREADRLVGELPQLQIEVSIPDSTTIYGWIEELCSTPHRRPGTPEGHRGEDYVEGKFREFGMEGVTRESIELTVWDARKWGLKVQEGTEAWDVPCFRVQNTAFTSGKGLSAPLVYVDKAWLPGAFKRAGVQGKIVVTDVPFPTLPTGVLLRLLGGGYGISDPENSFSQASRMKLIFVRSTFPGHFMDIDIGGAHLPLEDIQVPWDVYWRASRSGARGVVLILSNMLTNSCTHFGPYDAHMKPIPALWVGRYDGQRLRMLAKEGKSAALLLEGEEERGVTHNIWGVLPGESEETIIIHSHHDAPFQGATEDGCGMGQVLAQARAWSRVPREKRPKTLLFLSTAAHFYGPALGTYEFVRKHKEDVLMKTDVMICMEHLGARQVAEMDREFVPSGELATTWVMTSPHKYVIAGLMKVLREQRMKRTVAVPYNFIAPVPTTDAFPYPFADVGFLSFISQPYYLLNAEDTLDKIEVEELGPIAACIADLVKTYMALESEKLRET